eukprot:280067-Pelagomonas_calceolata.AAC.2
MELLSSSSPCEPSSPPCSKICYCPSDSGRLDKDQVKRLKSKREDSFEGAVASATAEVESAFKRQKQQLKQNRRQQGQQGGTLVGEPVQGEASREPSTNNVAACVNGQPTAEAKETGNAREDSQLRSPDLGAQKSYMGRTAGQLLADIDAAAAYVSRVLLPQLRSSDSFQDLLVQARAERQQAEAEQAAKAEERRRSKANKDKQRTQ